MADTVVGGTDDLSFVADTTRQVQDIYDAYRAGKLPMTGELAAALSQTREHLLAIKLDGSKQPGAADQRIAACVQIKEMQRAPTSDSSPPALAPATTPPVVQPKSDAMPATVVSNPAAAPSLLPSSYQEPGYQQPLPQEAWQSTGGMGSDAGQRQYQAPYPSTPTNAVPLPAPVGWQQSAWSASPPSTGKPRKPRFSLFRVLAAVAGIFAIGIAVPKVAVLLLHKGSSSPSASVPSGASPTSPSSALPTLESLLSTPPGSGFVLDRQAALNGYLSQAQIDKNLGSGLPPGTPVYAATWLGPNSAVVAEEAILTPNVADAEEFTAGLYNSTAARGGHAFDIPGLTGTAAGVTVPPAANHKPTALAMVARNKIGLLVIAIGTNLDDATTLAIDAAQTAATSVPEDPIKL
jgi:hypothetical protein